MRHAMRVRAGVSLFAIGIAVLGAAASAVAQERQYGAKVGPTFATLALEPEEGEGYSMRAGATGGLFYVHPLTPRIAVQLEGLYAQKGGKLNVPEVAETASILLGYVEFPVLLRLEGPRRGRTGFHAFAGAAPGFRATARRQLSLASGGFTSGVSEDMSDEIRFFEFSLIAGAGIEPHPRVVIDGRYSWGLTSINRDTSDGFNVRTRALTIMVGIRF